ncbi:Signal transduction histidine kinase [Terrisporobacter glycolicus]|nr:Signal transduction histidine kinase [Terrisporobacter glycolicus]
MKNNKKPKGSFFTLLSYNYIALTVSLIIIIYSLLMVLLVRIAGLAEKQFFKPITEYAKLLENGEYETFPINEMVGKGGQLFILDENNQYIYKSNSDVKLPKLNDDKLSYIKTYDTKFSVTIDKFTTSDKKEQISVVRKSNDREERYIFDRDYNIIYQSVKRDKTKFTKEEFDLMFDSLYKNYTVMKYPFVSESGKSYTALIYSIKENTSIVTNQFVSIIKETSFIFIVFYLILISVFMMWLSKKVKKPIKMLQDALEGFSRGKRQQYIDYNGPSEFVSICESFNEMSRRLYKSESEKEKLEQDKQKMLADISHDLKTPITVIQGYAKAINDGIASEIDKEQYLDIILQKSNNLNELINTFYEYSKMEHPDYRLTLVKNDIFNYLRNYVADKYNEFELEGFELDVYIQEEHVTCFIDEVQLKRAFDNIISNSIKHNHSGTTILCSINIIGERVRILLGDNGGGIPPELRDNIFEPFMVGEVSRHNSGSGLGLAISKKIVEAHNGQISLLNDGEMGYKTVFEIILPIKI